MRKFPVTTAAFAGIIAAAAVIGTAAKARPSYGGMMGDYGPGYVMGPGYGRGGNGYGERYRGKRLCWHPTDSDGDQGYDAPCK